MSATIFMVVFDKFDKKYSRSLCFTYDAVS